MRDREEHRGIVYISGKEGDPSRFDSSETVPELGVLAVGQIQEFVVFGYGISPRSNRLGFRLIPFTVLPCKQVPHQPKVDHAQAVDNTDGNFGR